MKTLRLLHAPVIVGLSVWFAAAAMAQSTEGSLPRPDPHFSGFVGTTFRDSEPAQFPQPVKAPDGAPNVLLIMLDDVGFGQFVVTGGGVPSPALDKLAKQGLLYNRFHTTALCSPTRAALLTGRNAHTAGTGIITELATGYDGYTGIIPCETATIAEVLRQNGYNTAWFGKNHNTPIWEVSANGKTIGSGAIEKTAPFRYSVSETQDIGMDEGTPVDNSYRPPFAFTGEIQTFTVELQ